MFRYVLFFFAAASLALAGLLHGLTAYVLSGEPKNQLAYMDPLAYDTLKTFSGLGVIVIAFALIFAFELKVSWLCLAAAAESAVFGFGFDSDLVLYQGWTQAAAIVALASALAVKVWGDWVKYQEVLHSPRILD